MKEDLTTIEKFEYIVEDPFFSSIHRTIVKVDDFSNLYFKDSPRSDDWKLHFEGLTDGMIEVLFNEWKRYQKFMDEVNELSCL